MANFGYVTQRTTPDGIRFFWTPEPIALSDPESRPHIRTPEPLWLNETRQIVGAHVQVVEIHDAQATRYCIVTISSGKVTQTCLIFADGDFEVHSHKITPCLMALQTPMARLSQPAT